MKTAMNLFVFILAFTVLSSQNSLQAQPQHREGGPMLPDSARILQRVDELANAVSLTAEQKLKATVLHFAHFAEVKPLMEDQKGDRDAMRRVMKDLRGKLDDQIKLLLTEDQKKAFEEFSAKQRERGGPPDRGALHEGRNRP